MELVRKNIHMDFCGNHTSTQVSMEDDFVIPDVKPDIREVVFSHCQVKLDDTKVTADHVGIQGDMEVSVLYQTDGTAKVLARVQKTIPIREEIYMEGVAAGDSIDVKWTLEDLTVSMINSRKLNIRTLLTFSLYERKMRDEEVVADFEDEGDIQYRKKTIKATQLAVSKKDIYRMRQEIEIANNLPNMKEILWDSVQGGNLEFRTQEDKILIKGEFPVFVLYEGEGDEMPVRFVESTLPVEGEIPCSGAREEMIPDISWQISHVEVDPKPDFDGEERLLSVEVVCSLDIKMYHEDEISLLSDVYGVSSEIEAQAVKGTFRRILLKNDAILKIDEKCKMEPQTSILQIIHQEAEAVMEELETAKDCVNLSGTLLIRGLYVTGDDARPYGSFHQSIPFTYTMDVKNVTADSILHVDAKMQQISLMPAGNDEMEVKAQIHLSSMAFEELSENIIRDIQVGELDQEKIRSLPGIIVYVAKEGESLWDIGKRYYVPVSRIKETNGMTQDTCKPMEKLLVVRV